MKVRYLTAGLLASTLLLTACGQGEKNEDTKSESKSDSGNKNDGSGFSNANKKKDSNSSSEHSSSHSDSKDNSNSSHDSSKNEDTNSTQYLAKVWAAALPGYRSTGRGQFDDMTITHYDVSGNVLNPYNANHSVKYPEGTQALSGSPTAAGSVIYTNNGDGTINVYEVPSHFQDHRWDEAGYSQSESERIMANPRVVKLYDDNQSALDEIASKIEEGGHLKEDIVDYNGNESTKESNDSDSSSDDSSSDDSSSSEKVTRENVIDKVEEYEGHKLDTETYTYKEPEQKSDGSWGFSFDDKEGNLAGSYIVDPDGHVTEYDADGNEV